MSKKIVIGDFILIATALLTAVLLFVMPLIFNTDGRFLSVTVKTESGNVTENYSLSEDRDIVLENNGIVLKVSIKSGKAFVFESTCRDKICLNSQSISRSGQSIICAPAGVSLTIKGGDIDADAVAG